MKNNYSIQWNPEYVNAKYAYSYVTEDGEVHQLPHGFEVRGNYLDENGKIVPVPPFFINGNQTVTRRLELCQQT